MPCRAQTKTSPVAIAEHPGLTEPDPRHKRKHEKFLLVLQGEKFLLALKDEASALDIR
jgi:hypothetical protein